MIRVCLAGLGKTGQEIAKVLLEQQDMKLVAAVCSPGSSKEGKDLGEILSTSDTGIIIESSENLEHIIFKTRPDVVIDFSKPDSTIRNAKVFSKMKVNMVIGTTGFSKMGIRRLEALTRRYHNGIVYAPNVTLGVNVMMLLTNLAASLLNDYDFEIMEMHHKNKKDSPSGTAVKIAKEIEKGLKSAGRDREEYIPINAIRAGGVVGKHEVLIIGENDKIEISHESFSRKTFAFGAVKAVKYIYGKSGYYEMSDVLNLKKVLMDYLQNDGIASEKSYSKFISG